MLLELPEVVTKDRHFAHGDTCGEGFVAVADACMTCPFLRWHDKACRGSFDDRQMLLCGAGKRRLIVGCDEVVKLLGISNVFPVNCFPDLAVVDDVDPIAQKKQFVDVA